MPDVVLLSGSASPHSRSTALLLHAQAWLAGRGLEATLLPLADLPALDLLHARYDSPAFAGPKALVAGARGLVVATPVYKASYTALLKAFLDILPQHGLDGKAVLPIANGGSPAHLLMIDFALKPVLSVLGATQLLQGVYAVDDQARVSPTGELWMHDELRERLVRGLEALEREVRSRAPGHAG